MADELDDLPVLKKSANGGYEKVYSQGDDLPVLKKKGQGTPTESSQDIPVVSLTDSQVQSEPLAEQPTPLGEKSGVEAKPYIDEETAGARTLLEKQIKSDVTKSGIKPVNKFELVNEKDRIEKEASKNYNIVDNNFRFGQVKQLKGLYDTLEQAKQGIGVTTDVKGLQQRIDDLRNQPVEMQMGVDSNGQQIPKAKSPYKTVGEMFDATIKAHNDFSAQKQKAQEIDNTLQPLIKEARDINKYKVTQKDEQGNEYYGMNPMESFMNAFDSSIDNIDIWTKNVSGNKKAAQDAMERKWVNENVLYPKRAEGVAAQATEMLGGVAPLIIGTAIAPEGAGALAMNALLFGASDYGGTLYRSYAEAKSKGLNTQEAFEDAESNARFAFTKGSVLGGTMPLQGMAGRKIFLNGAEAGAFKTFMAEQGIMAPAFSTSTMLQNWWEDKPITDGAARSALDAFIIGGMTHAITAIPNLPSKTKTVFENTIAKNYEALAPALNKIAEQGLISPETIKNIAEKSRAFKVVGKETPPSVEEKIIDKGVELNKVSDEISAIKKENPLAEPTELIQKAERLNREINEEKGVPLTSDERTEYAKLIEKRDQKVEKGEKKVELTEPEKEDLRHYEARIEKAKKLEEEAKTEAQKIKEANEEISKRAIELEPTITEPKTETDAIQEKNELTLQEKRYGKQSPNENEFQERSQAKQGINREAEANNFGEDTKGRIRTALSWLEAFTGNNKEASRNKEEELVRQSEERKERKKSLVLGDNDRGGKEIRTQDGNGKDIGEKTNEGRDSPSQESQQLGQQGGEFGTNEPTSTLQTSRGGKKGGGKENIKTLSENDKRQVDDALRLLSEVSNNSKKAQGERALLDVLRKGLESEEKTNEIIDYITNKIQDYATISQRISKEILSRQREGVSQEGGERSGVGQGNKGKEVAGEGEAQKDIIKNEFTGTNVFYHGAKKAFDKFQKIIKSGQDKEETEQPIFLSEDKEFADANAVGKDAQTLEVNVKNGKYFDFRKDIFNKDGSLTPLGEKIRDAVDSGEINLEGTRFSDYDGDRVLSSKLSTGDYDFIERKAFIDWLKKEGYDGVFLKEHPSQKSTNLAVWNIDKLEIKKQRESEGEKTGEVVTEKVEPTVEPTAEPTSQIFDRAFEAIKQRKKMAERDKILDEYGDKADKAKFVFKNWDKIKENLKQRAKEYEIEFKGDC